MVIARFSSADTSDATRAATGGNTARKANATCEARETDEGGTP